MRELSSDSGVIDGECNSSSSSSDNTDSDSEYSSDHSSEDDSSEDADKYVVSDSQVSICASADDEDEIMTDVTSTDAPPKQHQQQRKRAGCSIGQHSSKQPKRLPNTDAAAVQGALKGAAAAAAAASNRATSLETVEVKPGCFQITPVSFVKGCYISMPCTTPQPVRC